MKYKIIIDKEREEEVLIYAHERTRLVEEIEELIACNSVELIGYKDRNIIRIDASDVYCFSVEDNRVYAICENEKLQIKQRLYRLEEILDDRFVKINQSCIANIKKIKKFDATFSGALSVVFKNGHRDYVSRRQLKTVKERIGFNL